MIRPIESPEWSRYDPAKNNLLTIGFKSFLLGAVFATTFILEFTHSSLIPTCIYFQCLCLFHSLEFISTYLYNNTQVDDDSFILEEKDFLAVTMGSILEKSLTPNWLKLPNTIIVLGLILVAIGQITRTLSMYTAKESFNHYIQKSEKKSHTLVTTGIYRYVRHPSYLGFFIWFIGMELLLRNVFTLVVGAVILWRFFRDRIHYEERFLVAFFGIDYTTYKARTNTWMFI